MPPTQAQRDATGNVLRAGANTDSAGTSVDAEADNENDADANVTAEPEPSAAERLSEPLLQLDIDLRDGSHRVRTVFAQDNGRYLLQTDVDPQIYELSEYDLEGLLDLKVGQLMISSADEPGSESMTAPTGPASTAPAPALPEPPSGLPSKRIEETESPADVATTPAAKAADGGQPTSADTATTHEAPSEPPTEAPTDRLCCGTAPIPPTAAPSATASAEAVALSTLCATESTTLATTEPSTRHPTTASARLEVSEGEAEHLRRRIGAAAQAWPTSPAHAPRSERPARQAPARHRDWPWSPRPRAARRSPTSRRVASHS